MNALAPGSIDEISSFIYGHRKIRIRGASTKADCGGAESGAAILDLRGLSGILEYEPKEFTFTALAGTPLREIENILSANGQHLPCDPPLVDGGATLGGALASGLNGPCRLRYGGLRDFILGVKIVDGEGRLLQGGGKVVKNAAGFDLPKLMTGSTGRLGAIVAATFKVFPRPREWTTLRIACSGPGDALETMLQFSRHPLDLEAMDFEPPATLLLRISGAGESLAAHARRIAGSTEHPCESLTGETDAAFWRDQREFAWAPPENPLIKVPLIPRRIPELEKALALAPPLPPRRYSVAGNLAWISWPRERPIAQLDIGSLCGAVVRDPASGSHSVQVGTTQDHAQPFASRIQSVLDPSGRFPPLA